MAKVTWSSFAHEDVEIIAAYIARDSEYAASRFVDKLFNATDKLLDHPLIGRVVPERNDARIREIFCGSYRIIYRIEKSTVWIVGVIHGARNWKP